MLIKNIFSRGQENIMRKNKFLFLLFVLTMLTSCTYTNLTPKTTIWNHGPIEIIYKNADNELNTIYNYVGNGRGTESYYLSDYDKERIYKVANDIDWQSIPDSLTAIGHYNYSRHRTLESLIITFDGVNKSIKWTSSEISKYESLQMLKELTKVLKDVLFNNSSYRSLPKQEGYTL